MAEMARTQLRDRERPHPSPSYQRPSSRSSTSTSATRINPRSANSSTSHFQHSPRPSTAHTAHKSHHATCAQPMGTPRPASAVSRDRGSDSGRQSAASSYLQEKLQKRREEAERLAAVQSAQDINASMELPPRSHRGSPVKGESADGRYPGLGGGSGETPKKMGMGLKEMETTVSTLHKQNFDLKLELFHRRERQNALEERIDGLEAEKARMDDANEKLLDDLEKRDKAVQEAVQMILSLEAQVETLLKEREMVRQVVASGYLPLDQLEAKLSGSIPQLRAADLAQLNGDTKVLNRMPSFLSDRSENTENLRKVYLSSRGSVLSLRRLTTEGIEDPEGRRVISMTSPSLSVLSESSFTSVYGEKEDQEGTVVADEDEPSAMDGTPLRPRSRKPSYGSDQVRLKRTGTTTSATSSRLSKSNSIGRVPGAGQFHSINDIIGHSSPLQKLARLDHAYLEKSPNHEYSPTSGRGQSPRAKDAKREALRKVTPDAPPSRSSEQGLPPTPDTISTTTLRRFKTSNDTLSHQRGVSDKRSYRSISDGTSKTDDPEHMGGAPVFQQPLTSAFGCLNAPASAVFFDTRPPLIPRPRSAGATTISNRRDLEWDSDADSVHSLDSSLDIWLQQGRDPRHQDDRCESPDLFSFPSSGGGWATNAMFGSSGGAFDVSNLLPGRSNPVEDLASAQEALFPDGVETLPPPNRRSSLGAKTGTTSSAKHTPINGKLRKSPSRSGSRRNSADPQMLMAECVTHTPPHPELKPEPRAKDSHYPPSSGVASRGHRLNFFRRSIGGSTSLANIEPLPLAVEQVAAANAGPMGVPSWVQRSHLIDDDRASATPPPIMRVPRHSRSPDADEGAPIDDRAPVTPTTPVARYTLMTPTEVGKSASADTTPTSNNTGGGAPLNKRKWLPGFARASSLRKRAG